MDKKFQELLEKRAILDNELKQLERSILDNETKYLEETAYIGNAIKGWEGYLSMKNSKANPGMPRKGKINQNDRIFSQSSKTSPFIQETVQAIQTNNNAKIQNEGGDEEKKEYHFRRTKKKKYQRNDGAYHSPQSSSDEYPLTDRKVKVSKKS